MNKLASSCIAFLLLLMAGCAVGPRYQTVKRLVAPEGPAAQACLAKCTTALEECKQSCSVKYEACTKEAMPEAQAHFEKRLQHYQAELASYRWELERYRMELLLGWGYGHPYGVWGGYPPFPPPVAPIPPNREREIKKFVQQRCSQDCGCQTGYDACFLGCGGKIETETQCIANCGGAKP